MSYKALYRTYRPHSFETVVGQKHIVKTLQNALSQHKVSHAYLFCGPRGTGKTTVAKLVAKSVNCISEDKAPCNICDNCIEIQQGNHPDVIEIDAASNNGVDQIRELIEKVKYAPLQAKFKVYIIDEVHMLSQGAFNALLKTLEEPPSHVIFILATTEPHKVLPTIISRCQRYDFTRVSQKDIQGRIEEVLTKENIKFDHEATRLISQLSDGGVRDALSILEQVIAYSEDNLTAQHVNDIYGIATTQDKLKLLKAIQNQDVGILMEEIESITQKNIDIRRLTNDLMELLKESVIYAYTKDSKLLMKLTLEEAKDLNEIPSPIALKMIDDLMETTEKYRSASDVLSYFEIGLLKLIGHLNAPISQTATYQQNPIKNEKPKAVKVEKEIKVEPLIIEKPIQKEPELVVEKEIIVEKATEIELEKDEVKIVPQGDALSFDLNVEEVKPIKKLKNVELNDDFILQLLLSAEKQLRIKDSQNWENVKNHKGDSRYMKVANMVDESTIQASGPQFNLITFENKLKISTVNETNNIDDLAKLTDEVLGRATRLYALSITDYERVRNLFIQLRNEGKLPEKQSLEFFPKKTPKAKKENETLIKTHEFFDGNLVTIGESED
jgi:DNA polymerase-3 subunit gamma/tau